MPWRHHLVIGHSHTIPYPAPKKFKPAEFSRYSGSSQNAKICTHEIFYGYCNENKKMNNL